MSTLTYYVVRAKGSSNLCLPAPKIGSRGATWVDLSTSDLPRLFRRPNDALNAVRWWKTGKVSLSRTADLDDPAAFSEFNIDRQPERDIDLEVVPVTLTFPEPTNAR